MIYRDAKKVFSTAIFYYRFDIKPQFMKKKVPVHVFQNRFNFGKEFNKMLNFKCQK